MSHTIIEFMPRKSVMDPAPWPVVLDEYWYVVAGLENQHNDAKLVGFGPAGEQTVSVFAFEAMKNPERVVGMTPTFSDGNLFVWNLRVKEVRRI